MSSAKYFLNEIKRHRGTAAFASIAGLLLIASLVYFTNFTRGSSEAIDSVAVLPFVVASGEADAEHLGEGISDSVIASLSRLHSLRVISLNTVLRYKGQQVDPQTVGRELNVQAVMVGRLGQRAYALMISAELVDVRDGRRLWGQQYSRKVSDILVVQNEIAREISETLRLRINADQEQRLAQRNTEIPEVYQLYSLGRFYFRKQAKEALEKSIDCYKKAIEIDPNYGLAYIALGRAYHWMGSRGYWPSKDSAQLAEWAALKALKLDETMAEGHALLGANKYNDFDWAGAKKELERALELDPNSDMANRTYFQYLAAIGRTDEALNYAIRSNAIDPTAEPTLVAFAYFLARQYDKAIGSYQQSLAKNPDRPSDYILLGEALVAKGMAAQGVAEMQKGLALDTDLSKNPERWDRYPMLAFAYAESGRRDEALKILDQQQQLAQKRFVSPYNFAIIYTALRDNDQAFEWLAKCIEQRSRLVFRLKVRPMFDPLRSDPRYAELLRRMNLEP